MANDCARRITRNLLPIRPLWRNRLAASGYRTISPDCFANAVSSISSRMTAADPNRTVGSRRSYLLVTDTSEVKLDHITLYVKSLDRSIPYYDHLLPMLGFRKLRDYVWTDDDGFYFQFMQAKAGTPDYERYGAGMNHLGFGAKSSDQVYEIRSSMERAGFETPSIQDLGGAKALFMKDPDGIRFEVTYYPPGTSVVD